MKIIVFAAPVVLVVLSTGCTSSTTYLERGKKLYSAGKYEDASLNFRKAIQKDRNLGEAYHQLGLSEIKRDDFVNAYQSLLHAAQLLPSDQDVKITLANVCIELYRADPRRPKALYDQLVQLVNSVGSKNSSGYDALRLRGYLAVIDNKLKDGIGYFEQANQVKPLQPEVVINLMRVLTQDRQFGEAEKLGEQMLQKDKANGPVYDVLYSAYRDANDLQGAENVLKRKVANNPKQAEYRLQLAQYYLRVQKNSDAAAVIKDLLDHPADFPQIYLETGNFYAGNGRWEEAMRLYQLGTKIDPKNKVAYQRRITAVLLAQDKREEAAQMVDATLREAPKDPESLQLRAVLLLDTRKPENIDKALAQFQVLSQQAPKDIPLRFNLAKAYLAKSDWAAARKELSEVLRDNPAMLQARLLLAEIAYKLRQPSEILSQITPVLVAQPGNPRARFLHAVALMGLGNAADAGNELNRLIRDEPKYVDAQIELGLFDLAQKKNHDAEAIFRKFYDPGRTNFEALEGLATVLTLRGQPEEAFHVVDQEAQKAPPSSALRFLLAKTAAQAGKEDVALDQLRQVVQENPGAVDADVLLAELYARKGDLAQARTVIEKARDAAPKDVRPYVLLAALEGRAGETPRAIASYRQAIALRPDDASLLNDVAFYFAENGGDLDEALQLARRAVEKLNGESYASDTLAWIYLKKNMTEPALQILTTLVKRYPDAAVYRYHLGAALAAKGDRERARAELRAALLKKPAKQDEAKIRELLARLG